MLKTIALLVAGYAAILLALVLVFFLVSCTGIIMGHEPVTRTVPLQSTPEAAYQQSVQAMALIGAEVVHQEPSSHLVQGKLHNAVLLTVVVQPSALGAHVHVTATILPNKLIVGQFTEVDQYIALLHQRRRADVQ